MLWIEELFQVKKPIIAMLHLDPLPGDPMWKYGMNMEDVVEDARKDLHALQDGGVDGIIFSNEFSFPYQRNMDRNTSMRSPTASPAWSWRPASMLPMCAAPSPASTSVTAVSTTTISLRSSAASTPYTSMISRCYTSSTRNPTVLWTRVL